MLFQLSEQHSLLLISEIGFENKKISIEFFYKFSPLFYITHYSNLRSKFLNIFLCIFYCRELRKYRPGKILLHLCCNLCISYIVFIVGAFLNSENTSLCVASTFLFHYFYLVSWSWMGIYGYEIYNGLVKVGSSRIYYNIKWISRTFTIKLPSHFLHQRCDEVVDQTQT